nr:SH3 domain-containing protein [uncultured Pseudomonas sp.]
MSDEKKAPWGGVGNSTNEIFKVGKSIQSIIIPHEIYRIGQIAKSLSEFSSSFARSQEMWAIGEAVKKFQVVAKPMNVVATNSTIGRLMSSITDINKKLNQAMVDPNSDLFRGWRSVAEFSSAFNAVSYRGLAEFAKSPANSELISMLRSGQFTSEQLIEGFEEAVSVAGVVEGLPAVDVSSSGAELQGEVVSALMGGKSLKGLSLEALRYYIFFIICSFFSDPIGAINKGFELQKNLSGLFTKVETPAEARAIARHMPQGVDKSSITGFRILTGDGVYLREGPGKRFDEVLKVKIGALLQVLDSSHKSWILVSVVVDGELYEGWVLRGYTKRIE